MPEITTERPIFDSPDICAVVRAPIAEAEIDKIAFFVVMDGVTLSRASA